MLIVEVHELEPLLGVPVEVATEFDLLLAEVLSTELVSRHWSSLGAGASTVALSDESIDAFVLSLTLLGPLVDEKRELEEPRAVELTLPVSSKSTPQQQ